jgi:hypothetical protein
VSAPARSSDLTQGANSPPAGPLPVRRPSESAITEGNLAELPIWVLSNKEARRLSSTASLDAVTLATYTKVLQLAEGSSVAIEASPKHGFPTMFAYRVLLVVLDTAQKDGLQSRLVRLSRYDIALRLGYRQPGSAVYDDIENALRSLASIKFEFRDSWCQRNGSGRRGALGFTGLAEADYFFALLWLGLGAVSFGCLGAAWKRLDPRV